MSHRDLSLTGHITSNPVTDEEKHAYARRRGYPHAVFLHTFLYEAAERAGQGNHGRIFGGTLKDNLRQGRKNRDSVACHDCMPGKGGTCVCCVDKE